MRLAPTISAARQQSRVLQAVVPVMKENNFGKTIDDYRQGTVPLTVPLKLIEHHFRRHPSDYVALQVYLNPHPAELGLRNHL